jgi:hypothetical protein
MWGIFQLLGITWYKVSLAALLYQVSDKTVLSIARGQESEKRNSPNGNWTTGEERCKIGGVGDKKKGKMLCHQGTMSQQAQDVITMRGVGGTLDKRNLTLYDRAT